VTIISRSLARTLFGPADPVGQMLRVRDDTATVIRIVGVAGDVSLQGPRQGVTPTFYRPLTQIGPWPYVELVVRTRTDDPTLMTGTVAALRTAVPGIRVRNLATASDRLQAWLIRETLMATLAS